MNLAPVLEWVSQRLKYRPIYDGELLYLERHYIGKLFSLTFFLHKICASDPDRGVHDHPWNSFSILLAGSYDEEVLIPRVQDEIDRISSTYPRGFPGRYGLGKALSCHRRVRWFNSIPGTKFHRLVLIGSVPVWTLFVHGKRRKSWGFWRHWEFEPFEEAPELWGKRAGWFDSAKTKRQYLAERTTPAKVESH